MLALSTYNSDLESITELRTTHDGHIGGSMEQILYLRNHDVSKYFTNITVTPKITGAYDDTGEFGTTGWGVKVLYGSRRPTEMEWDLVRSGDGVILPDIGTTEAADTTTNHPIWVRVYCPGGEPAQIRNNLSIEVQAYTREVGA